MVAKVSRDGDCHIEKGVTCESECRMDFDQTEQKICRAHVSSYGSWFDLWEELCSGIDMPDCDEAAVAVFSLWRNKPIVAARSWMSWIFQEPAECSHLTTVIRNGIRPSLRGDMWYTCSYAGGKQLSEVYSYTDLLNIGNGLGDVEAARIIEADLHRTGIEGIDQGLLRNVLLAFVAGSPHIGYCQGMNIIAGTLLQHLEDERAFWTLRSLLEDLLPPEYFTIGMLGLRTDLKVLDVLIQTYLPSLHDHLENEEVDLSPITMNWFLCLFLNTLPMEIAYQVIDCVMHEGPEVLFRVALGLLQQREPELLEATSLPDIFKVLQKPLQNSGAIRVSTRIGSPDSLTNGEDLFKRMYGSWLCGWCSEELAGLRAVYMPAVRAEDSIAAAWREAKKYGQDRFVWTPISIVV